MRRKLSWKLTAVLLANCMVASLVATELWHSIPHVPLSASPRRPQRPASYKLVNGTLALQEVLFDWRAYQFYNLDLGKLSEASARAHYEMIGAYEGRIFARIPMTLVYRTGYYQGLCNQLYAHIFALTLAAHLGADVIVPPAWSRTTFSSIAVPWKVGDPNTLLDVEAMSARWEKSRGSRLYMAPYNPDLPSAEQIDGMWNQIQTDCVVVDIQRSPEFHLKPLANVTQSILRRVQQAVRPVLRGGPHKLQGLCLMVTMDHTYASLSGAESLPLVTEVANNILFPPTIVAAANAILQQLSGLPFYGVHLRTEGDVTDLALGAPRGLEDFIDAMKDAGFQSSTPVYIASGFFSYQPMLEVKKLKKRLRSESVVGPMYYKERILNEELLKSLKSEQLALIDLLVLAKAQVVVGYCGSSFSWFVRELRALRGLPKNSTRFVAAQRCRSREDVEHSKGWVFTP